MKINDLVNCLEECNRKAFERLEELHGLSSARTGQTPAAREYARASGGSLVDPQQSVGDFDGWNSAGEITRASMEAWIDFPITPPAIRRVALGGVIDAPPPGTRPADLSTDDLPVVLTVDMNQGWWHRRDGEPASNLPGLFVDTGLRGAVESTVKKLNQRNLTMKKLGPETYHLVAAGFFPWVTTRSWETVSQDVYGEELLQRYLGWRNPLEFIVETIRTLHAVSRDLDWHRGLNHIIFHGASGAITRAGLAAAGQLTREPHSPGTTLPLHRSSRPMSDWLHPEHARRMGPDVILCDDLVHLPIGGEIKRAIWLSQEDLTGDPAGVMKLPE